MPSEAPRPIDVWRLRIRRERRDGGVVLRLTGRIGAASVAELSTELEALIEEGERRLVIDLEEVDYVSGEGLKALDAARSRLVESGGRLLLRGVGDAVRISFELAGLAGLFPSEESPA